MEDERSQSVPGIIGRASGMQSFVYQWDICGRAMRPSTRTKLARIWGVRARRRSGVVVM